MNKLTNWLFENQDLKFRDFQGKLIPTVERERMIGVRTPALRSFARELVKTGQAEAFLQELPHRYFEENQLHAFILSQQRDFQETLRGVEAFMPYVDNWATCDQLLPKSFARQPERLLEVIPQWLRSGKIYTMRFGIGMLLHHFLDDRFDPEHLNWVAQVHSREYYVNMMIAWYFATALAKQYEAALPYLTEHRLSPWVHNKTVSKAMESFRVAREHKEFLKTLKISGSLKNAF